MNWFERELEQLREKRLLRVEKLMKENSPKELAYMIFELEEDLKTCKEDHTSVSMRLYEYEKRSYCE